jgi:hypothetical protein
MAFDIPVDLDYFDHPKTKRLCILLKKPEGDIYPLRLWKWCAKYAKDGILPPDVPLIEAELGWRGAPGRLHGSLMGTGFIESDGVTVHDWMEHIGRAILIYERKKRKMREKYDLSSGILPEDFRQTSGSLPPTQDTQDTQDTQEARHNGADAPKRCLQAPEFLAGVDLAIAKSKEPKPEGNPRDEQIRLIFQRAEKLHLRNNPGTLKRWISAHVYGGRAQKLNDLFFSDQCQGMSTIEIDERWFNHRDSMLKTERERGGPPKI